MPFVTITCHTSGCPNEGDGFDVEVFYVDPVTGEDLPPTTFMCGPCQQEITDVQPHDTTEGKEPR